MVNNFISIVAGVFGGGILSAIALFLYTKLKVASQIDKGADFAVQEAGYMLYKYVLCNIKDEKLRKQLQEDLDHTGNNFNEVWDKGIYGEKPIWGKP